MWTLQSHFLFCQLIVRSVVENDSSILPNDQIKNESPEIPNHKKGVRLKKVFRNGRTADMRRKVDGQDLE